MCDFTRNNLCLVDVGDKPHWSFFNFGGLVLYAILIESFLVTINLAFASANVIGANSEVVSALFVMTPIFASLFFYFVYDEALSKIEGNCIQYICGIAIMTASSFFLLIAPQEFGELELK